jgi:anti-anti-sigma regulatory factor
LSDVDFIDSQGINELVRAHLAGLQIFITAASPLVRRVLDISQIEPSLTQPTH